MGWFTTKKSDDGLVDANDILKKENALAECQKTGKRIVDGNVAVAPLGNQINWEIKRGDHPPARGRVRKW